MNNEQLDHFKFGDDGERYAGDHLLIEFWGAKRLHEPEYICQALEDGARHAGATILHSHYHHFGEGSGVSGVTVLAESHISIHTWPEVGYAAIDVFMCVMRVRWIASNCCRTASIRIRSPPRVSVAVACCRRYALTALPE